MTAARLSDLAQRYYRPHLWLFCVSNVLLTVVNIIDGAPWWALWPLAGWGLMFSIHFFIYKSLTVDESWADDRIDDLRWRSYDLGHVEDLEDRIRADDFSTRPAHRRDPEWWQRPAHKSEDDEEPKI
jgi:hypothetical protein